MLSTVRKQVYELYWVQGLPQLVVARETHLCQQRISQLARSIRDAYAKEGIALLKPKAKALPRAHTGRRFVEPGVVHLDICSVMNRLRDLHKTKSGSIAEGMILGTLVDAIQDDKVFEMIAKMTKPAARRYA